MIELQFLLLEDNPLDAEVIRVTLKEGGIDCQLRQVETRDELITALKRDRFDLILADYALPAFDGLTALEITLDLCPDVPFIFVSARMGEELAIESLKHGATDYVLKQQLERLVPCVRRALQEAQKRRECQQFAIALREREAQFRSFAENSNDVIWIAEAREYRLIYVSPSYERIWGRSSDEIYADLNNFITYVHPEDRDLVFEWWQHCRQEGFIEDILDISRILRGQLSLDIIQVDLVATIHSAIETVRLAAESKSIQIHTNLEPDVLLVSGDPNRLQQVLWNLLSNAIKFTPEGGRVDICLENLGSTAQITVSDTGKGIDPEFLPSMFNYFTQEGRVTTRKYGGLGLGLAIVRHLVELHGGTIQADSPGDGKGATFTLRLPRKKLSSPTSDNHFLDEPALNLDGMEILIVDDDPDTLKLVAFILKQYGAKAIAVSGASEALDVFTHSPPDILLSDIGMPEVDGYMLLRQIRDLPVEQGGQIPAIALTAFAGELDHQRAISAGFQHHIPKPIEPAKLVKTIVSLASHKN